MNRSDGTISATLPWSGMPRSQADTGFKDNGNKLKACDRCGRTRRVSKARPNRIPWGLCRDCMSDSWWREKNAPKLG